MISQTEQSTLRYDDDAVLKTYKKHHILFNEKYFQSEVKALSTLSNNKYFIDAYDIGDCSYRMKRYDFSLGTADRLNYIAVSRVLFSLDIDEIFANLDEILLQLKQHKILHRDINPGNLLYSQKERLLKLTDFFWCSNNGEQPSLPPIPSENHPWPVNGVYGTDDYKAMDKIKAQIKHFYDSYFVINCDEIKNKFISTVGYGEYKDGSSVFKGFAYHIIDIPQFKNKIRYHKDTCIQEYKTIKENMPIEPRSFIDIGMACGYFTFNLLRDYRINRCIGYEADKGVNQFLYSIKNLYSQPMEIEERFDNTTIIKDDYDIAIFLNSHMWIYRQLGALETLRCVTNILNHCRYMFFQTCAAYSSGMYRVMEYRRPADIEKMLYNAGSKNVKMLDVFVGSHDAPRHMFLAKGLL